MTIRQVDPFMPEVLDLLEQSDQLMTSLYPAESNHLEQPQDLARDNVILLGAYDNHDLLGCGAVKIMQDDSLYGEIKRMFVLPDARGKGVASGIMKFIEDHLITLNVPAARLETGIHQHDAINLYRKLGYREREPFGVYRADPLSLYMEKILPGNRH